MGIQAEEDTKKGTCKHSISRREREIQKKTEQILVDKQQKQQEKQSQETSFTIVSLDESFFFYDSLVRRVWIDKNKRPIVRITGSHKHSCIFGAISIEGKQLFRQYDVFNGDTFLDFIKKIHAIFKMLFVHG